MFIKQFDMLSPPITLFFRGEKKHHSYFSAFLTILAYTIIVIFGIYYILEFINRENPTAYFFNRYVDDAGVFPVNSTSMFSFIQLVDTVTNKVVPMDFQAFRILGFDEVYANTYISDDDGSTPRQREPTEFNHWLYGPCNNKSDTSGIGYLIDFDHFEESACIRKYYDKNKRRYFDTNDPNFRWPVIVKGCSNPERTFYGIIMEKCRNDEAHSLSGYAQCKTESEINNVINKNSVILQLMDQYADALNYEMPFEKYFYAVTTALTSDNYVVNHLNFNPSMMITHNGFFFDNIVKEPSYLFTQNEKQTILTDNSSNVNIYGCLLGFYFWMQNSLQYYERNYKRIQDILSDIGGINNIVIAAAEVINFIVKGYIIILDTQDLISSIDDKNFNEKELNKRPSIFKKNPEKLFPPKRLYYNNNIRRIEHRNDQQQSNYQRLMKDGIDIYQNISSKENEKSEFYKNNIKRKYLSNNYIDNSEQNSQQINKGEYKGRGNNTRENYSRNLSTYNEKKEYTNSKALYNEQVNERKGGSTEESSDQKISYFSYIKYIICFKKNNSKILYYEDFRNEVISEENLLQFQIDIYQLLKFCKINREPINYKINK